MNIPLSPQELASLRARETATRLQTYIAALISGDILSAGEAWRGMTGVFERRRAFQRVSRLQPLPRATREYMHGFWVAYGQEIRDEIGDDAILLRALGVLLPVYEGPDLTLYRGETMFCRRRGRYGISWTRDLAVAREFAAGEMRSCVGGSVVLRAAVPANAIIFSPHLSGSDTYGESEYLVDRRGLGVVGVIERFAEVRP